MNGILRSAKTSDLSVKSAVSFKQFLNFTSKETSAFYGSTLSPLIQRTR